MTLTTATPRPYNDRAIRAGLFAAWLAVVGYLQVHHALWRDEVRAYTLALEGRTVIGMLAAIHGEGHPALWYMLLRGMHAVVGSPVALPLSGFLVGTAAAALFAFRAPFRPPILALGLFGAYALFDYTTIARNYGISMLLLFLFADCYARLRDRGIVLGIILFLLSNTNAPSVLLAAGLLLFWAVELLCEQGLRWTPKTRIFTVNAGIAAVGAIACLLTIYPPYNDAVDAVSAGGGIAHGWLATLDLSASFATLASGLRTPPGGSIVFTALLVGAPLGLLRGPPASARRLRCC